MTLFVIDKSRLITERLSLLVKEAKHIDAVYSASTFSEAVILMQAIQPDIVLLDMNLPGSESLELIKTIKATCPGTTFIVLFNQVNEIKKQYCEFLGVRFIFDKYHDIENIIPAIDTLTSSKRRILNP